MAKSKNFFGIRRGSTKSLTFTIGHTDGNVTQITKDRTTYNRRNKMSVGQSSQTIKMVMLAFYWRKFPAIKSCYQSVYMVNNNYEMFSFGVREDPYNEYMTDNLKRYPFTVYSYPTPGGSYMGLGDVMFSRGRLQSQIVVEADGDNIVCAVLGSAIMKMAVKNTMTLDRILVNNYGVTNGSILTFYIVRYGINDNGTVDDDTTYPGQFAHTVNVYKSTSVNSNGQLYVDGDGNLRADGEFGSVVIDGDGEINGLDNLKILQCCLVVNYGNVVSTSRFAICKKNIIVRISAETARQDFYGDNTKNGGGTGRVSPAMEGGNDNKPNKYD